MHQLFMSSGLPVCLWWGVLGPYITSQGHGQWEMREQIVNQVPLQRLLPGGKDRSTVVTGGTNRDLPSESKPKCVLREQHVETEGVKGQESPDCGIGQAAPIEGKVTGNTNRGPCVDRTRDTVEGGTPELASSSTPRAGGWLHRPLYPQLPDLRFPLLVYPPALPSGTHCQLTWPSRSLAFS